MSLVVIDSHTAFFAKHLILFVVRFAYAALIVIAFPESHVRWCESLQRGDIEGQKASGFILTFYLIGLVAATIYLFTTCLAHNFLQKCPWRSAVFDGLLFVVIGGVLVYMGVNAEYQ